MIGLYLLIASIFTPFNAGTEWRTVRFPGLYIHYQQSYQQKSLKIAQVARDCYCKLPQKLKPKESIHIILSDFGDIPLDQATVFPDNRIYINIFSHPGIIPQDPYFIGLLSHELTHIAANSQRKGFNAVVGSILGNNPLTFSNALAPLFIQEGIATLQEGSLGRGNSTYFKMLLNRDILFHNVPRIDQISFHTDKNSWYPYLYGALLLRDLSSDYFKKIAAYPIYSRYFFGDGYSWQNRLNRAISKITPIKLSTYPRIKLLKLPFDHIGPIVVTKTGIYGIDQPFRGRGQFFYWGFGTKKPVVIRETVAALALSVIKNGISLIDIDGDTPLKQFYTEFQFKHNMLNQKKRHIVYRDGDLTIEKHQGDYTLKIKEHTVLKSRLPLMEGARSLDGRQIVFVAHTPDNRYDLYLFKNHIIKRITHTGLNRYPKWTLDGGIYFLSDCSGFFQIHHFDINNKEITQVSSLLTGVLYYDLFPCQKQAAVTILHQNGTRVGVIALNNRKNRIKSKFVTQHYFNQLDTELSRRVPSHYLPSFTTRYFTLGTAYNGGKWPLKFFRSHHDPLGFHQYSIDFRSYLKGKYGDLTIDYTLSPLFLNIYYHTESIFKDRQNHNLEQLQVLFKFPLFTPFYQLEFGGGYLNHTRYRPESIYQSDQLLFFAQFDSRVKNQNEFYRAGGYLKGVYRMTGLKQGMLSTQFEQFFKLGILFSLSGLTAHQINGGLNRLIDFYPELTTDFMKQKTLINNRYIEEILLLIHINLFSVNTGYGVLPLYFRSFQLSSGFMAQRIGNQITNQEIDLFLILKGGITMVLGYQTELKSVIQYQQLLKSPFTPYLFFNIEQQF